MASLSAAQIIILVIAVISYTLCGDITNTRNANNPWSQTGTTNGNVAPNQPLGIAGSKSTTPWPALGQRRNQQRGQNNNNQQPKWVQEGSHWVRNGAASNQNTNDQQPLNAASQAPRVQNSEAEKYTPIQSPTNQNQRQTNLNQGPSNANRPNPTRDSVWSGGNPLRNRAEQNTNFLNSERGTQPVRSMNGAANSPNLNQRPLSTGSSSVNNLGNRQPVNQNQGNANPVFPAGNVPVVLPSTNNGMKNVNSAGQSQTNTNENSNTNDVTTDDELRQFSEELISKDVNNAARFVTINWQGMTTSRSSIDEAPKPLLSVNNDAFTIPSIEKIILLFNNYILETDQNEVYTAQERIEENNLLDTVLSTPVMQHTRNFLISKGKIGKDPKEFKDILKLIWFNMYSRGQGRIGSSGFEHVFLAELKNNKVLGQHNWIYYAEEEKKNNANYMGYMKKIDLGNKGAVIKLHYTLKGVEKHVGGMFIGTSPELEMALYSTCFLLRADKICPVKISGNRFIIRTFTYRYRSKNMIGSAFPEI